MSEPDRKLARLELYLAELVQWGERTNLVGSTSRTALDRHVADSVAAAELLPEAARIVDLGSGAGFPGIPLAIVRPDLRITLVEIRERRVHFLRHVVRVLGLECRVERRRLEEPLEELFEFALLRAVAQPAAAHRLAVPWVVRSGEIWIWVGPGIDAAPAALIDRIPLRSGGSILQLSPG